MRPRRLTAFAVALAAAIGLAAAPPAAAQSTTLIRDAEIERTIRMMSDPIFEAAGIRPDGVRQFILLDPTLNAFVAGRDMVFHTGLLSRLERPETLIGVIAHETGHITGGHLAARAIAMEGVQGPAALALLLAVAAGAASGSAEAGLATALGGQSAIERSFLAFSRAQEAAADQAGIDYMVRAGFDPEGMLDILNMFRGQEVFQSSRIDPFAQTHPLSAERMALLERRIAEAPTRGRPTPPEIAYWHARMRAKLEGFLNRPELTLSRLERVEDPDSEVNLYRRAIALHRAVDSDGALEVLDRLEAMRPDDPYYLALRGQILFEAGRPAEAVAPLRRAVALAPGEPLIAGSLGRALLASGLPGSEEEALETLKRATRADPGEPGVLRDLAIAYARAGEDGMAALSTAERIALSGDFGEAGIHARRALDLLPRGSPGWLRAEDIATLAERADR